MELTLRIQAGEVGVSCSAKLWSQEDVAGEVDPRSSVLNGWSLERLRERQLGSDPASPALSWLCLLCLSVTPCHHFLRREQDRSLFITLQI